jgi:cytochrome c nitrite reductase small subunit
VNVKRKERDVFPDLRRTGGVSINIHDKAVGPDNRPRALLLGTVLGMMLAALYAGAYHYMGTSTFCMTCHSMEGAGAQWKMSGHKQFGCIDCHLPAGNPFGRFIYKVHAGVSDVMHETIGNYPLFINVSEKGRTIVNQNCLRCHYSTVERTPMVEGGENCVKCHRRLVHGRDLAIAKGALANE